MTNIFNFRPNKKGATDSDFLKDADDTVEFGPTGRDVQLRNTPEYYLSDQKTQFVLRDWSNQELANIYRVKKLLDAAGVPNELERGVSDEGDPWCIFCTLNGDVFIHLCRVDGRYVLDSPNLRAPISGVDFTDMIAEFSSGALRATPTAEKGSRRVIKLQRNGKVFLHPAALLAALIWSIYLNSEDLVIFAPEDDADDVAGADSIALINEAALAPLPDEDAEAAARFMDTTALPDHVIGTRLAEEAALRGEDVREGMGFRDFAGKSAMMMAPTPIAVGLSSIAIAFGIMTEGYFDSEEEVEVAAADQPMAEIPAEGPPVERDSDAGGRGPAFDLVAVLKEAFEDAPIPEQVHSALYTELSAGIDLTTVLSSMLELPLQTDLPIDLADTVQDNWVDELPVAELSSDEVQEKKQIETTENEDPEEVQPQDILPETVDVVIASPTATPETTTEYASLVDFKASVSSAFETFDFDGLTIEATFDIASISPLASDLLLGSTLTQQNTNTVEETVEDDVTEVLGDLMDDTLLSSPDTIDLPVVNVPEPQKGPSFSVIDVNARAFIEFLMGQSKEIEVLALAREIILIDFEAVQAQSVDTFSMSWSLADGGTVSTIGLRSDFQEFDLIA